MDVGGEKGGVFVGFDDVADAEGVDVGGGEAAGKGAGAALAAEFAEGVGVHWVCGRGGHFSVSVIANAIQTDDIRINGGMDGWMYAWI